MKRNPQVIVAGAGPVGLLTALALAEQGVRVLVLEAEPALTIDLRAGTYHPPSMVRTAVRNTGGTSASCTGRMLSPMPAPALASNSGGRATLCTSVVSSVDYTSSA